MSHRSKPAPKTSVAMKSRKPVGAHASKASVGHSVGSRSRKTVTDPANGRYSNGARPVTAIV
jgi:hypothetical protein